VKTDEAKLLANVIVLEVQRNKNIPKFFFSPMARHWARGSSLIYDMIYLTAIG
jgi:hypothetical protein